MDTEGSYCIFSRTSLRALRGQTSNGKNFSPASRRQKGASSQVRAKFAGEAPPHAPTPPNEPDVKKYEERSMAPRLGEQTAEEPVER